MPKQFPYQLFDPLTPEEYAALKADIEKRGIQIPVEKDGDGNTLDGHHREQIADELGIKCPTVTRHFKSEQEKREHVIKLNLARRHLDPIRWGRAFAKLLEERGVQLGRGGDRKSTATVAVDTVKKVAAEVGVPERTARQRVSQAKKFDALPAKVKKEVASGKKSAQKAIKQAKAEEKKAAAPVPATPDEPCCTIDDLQTPIKRGVRFGTIYADPPWSYGNQGTRAATGNHYETMGVEEIAALPIPQLAADECHLHLWTTNAFLEAAIALLKGWGFEFKSTFVWVKPQLGIGNYWRCSHEIMLLGVKGGLTYPPTNFKSWIEADRTEHSAKPERVREMIEHVSPGPRLELFGRKTSPGWSVFGNEIKRSLFDAAVEAMEAA